MTVLPDVPDRLLIPPNDYTTSDEGTPINITDGNTALYFIVVDYYALQMMGFEIRMGLMQYFQYIGVAYSGQIPTAVYKEDGTGTGRSEAAVPPAVP